MPKTRPDHMGIIFLYTSVSEASDFVSPVMEGKALIEGVNSVGIIGVVSGVWAFNRVYNATKLLNGDYVFCSKPPKKEEKVKATTKIMGGVTNHAFTPL